MLQFWKKPGQEQNVTNPSSPFCNSLHDSTHLRYHRPTEKERLPLANFDDEGLFDVDEFESSRERSRLSKTLQEVLTDKNALNYLIQFLESRNASQYIMCWLDLQGFKSDLTASLANVKLTTKSGSQMDHDSLSVSTDCDSYTADSNSLCDYSTTNALSDVTRVHEESCDSELSDNLAVQIAVDNALVIFKKYIAQEAECNIRCTEEMRKEIMENICSSEKVKSGVCFKSVQDFVYDALENEYFSAFLGSDCFCKYQIDVLTSGNIVLDDILYNETALFYFMEYLEQENNRSLLEFWIAASNFQQQLQDQKEFFNPSEAQSDAVVLYDKYFSLQALCPLGFSDKVRFAVEQNICGENGLILDCFHLPIKIVEKVMEKDYLKPFLASQLFYKYLSDLINTVQSCGYSTIIERPRSYSSDCGSEKSFSQSTFLALEVPQKKSDKGMNMSIDTHEMYNPDSLWKRKKFHRLSLGHVNELGKYEADFEPEPDKKEFRLKNMLKKVVKSEDEDRRKEELAWQVAEMIVKDITSVTLGRQDS